MRISLSAALLLLTLPVLARENDTGFDLLAWALQTGAMLAFVLGLFFALTLLIKRAQRYPAVGRQMQLLETLPISRNEKLCRVQVGDQVLVIGVTPGGITRLGEQPVELAEHVIHRESPFANILRRCRSAGEAASGAEVAGR